jgi:hypothetical protein
MHDNNKNGKKERKRVGKKRLYEEKSTTPQPNYAQTFIMRQVEFKVPYY